MKIAAVLLLVLSSLGVSPAHADALSRAFAAVADQFEATAKEEQIVGGSLYFVHNGRTVGFRHFGLADEEAKQPVDADTIYHWASITKTFTAVAAMQLVARGLIDLDAPVVDYLPEFKRAHNPFGPITQVTVRHLITHSSGLRAPTWPWSADGAAERPSWQQHEPTEWSQIAAMMPYTGLAFAPGSKRSYSNPGLSMLGRIVEVVSGDDIEVYVTKNVLMPLGMTRSYFDITPYYLQPQRSNSYEWNDKGERHTYGREFDTGVTTGNGGLNAPVTDMIRWVNFLSGIGDPARNETVLPRATLEKMWEPLGIINTGSGPSESMGQVFFILDAPGADGKQRRYVGHTGSQQGFRAFIYVLPGSRAAAVMAVNTTVEKSRGLFGKTRSALFEKVFPLAERAR
jgi:CubicO group peptidase (beta-lactamase class C family)